MKPSDPHSHNRAAWNRLAKNHDRLATPANDEDFVDSLAKLDPKGWLGDITGKQLLCLAAGGGRQGPMYAAAGAKVTVVDISPAMLELDRQVASERGMNLRTVEASMDNLRSLESGEFDVVIHPVSTCYVPDVKPVYHEVARVLRSGGIYVSQHKQPASLQASIRPESGSYAFKVPYYLNQPLPPCESPNLVREDGTVEYLHRWEELLGQMCRAGLLIEDLSEPFHAKPDENPGTFAHRSQFVAPYVRVKARKSRTESKLVF